MLANMEFQRQYEERKRFMESELERQRQEVEMLFRDKERALLKKLN